MIRLLSLLAVLLGMLAAHPARAEAPRRPALHWSRGEGAASCIDPHTLALQVVALTGPVLVDASEADVSIEGHIARVGPRFEARISATGRDGVARGGRTLQHAGECRALDRALAFVIALLIDPDLTLERLPPTVVVLGAEGTAPEAALLHELNDAPPRPTAQPSAPQSPAPAKPDPPAKAAAQEEPPRSRLTLQFGFGMSVRELPRPSLGLWASVSGLPQRFFALEFGLRSTFMLGRYDLGARSVDAQSLSANLLVCPRYPWERVYVELCAGPDGVLLRARGNGFSDNKAAYRLAAGGLFAVGAGVRVRGDWSLHLRGLVRILFNRPVFTYEQPDGESRAFVSDRVAFGVNLAAGYRF